jgi:hypothetical protein
MARLLTVETLFSLFSRLVNSLAMGSCNRRKMRLRLERTRHYKQCG